MKTRPFSSVSPRARSTAGISLVEVMFSTMVIAVSLLATMGSIATSMQVSRTVNEREIAQRAASAVLQDMAATDFAKVLATYDASTANDPGGLPAPGEFFAVPGLTPPPGVPAAEAGQILFPTVGTQIREDVTIPELGMPRDLNGDGVVDSLDHTLDFKILPVLVMVRWKGVDGIGSITMPCILSSR